MMVRIRFQDPVLRDSTETSPIREQRIEEVPMREAWQMALDFVRYRQARAQDRGAQGGGAALDRSIAQDRPSAQEIPPARDRAAVQKGRYKIYWCLQSGKEVAIKVDFENVDSLQVLYDQEEESSNRTIGET